MKNKLVVAVALLVTWWSSFAFASTVTFSYDSFYDRLKVVNKGEFEFARVGFYLVDTVSMQPCQISSGNIVTESANFQLSFTEEAQLLLPFDKALDKDKAKVIIDTQGGDTECQLKMQIEAELFHADSISRSDLYKMQMEFESLLADLSGFFIKHLLSFLLPEHKGVIVTFNDDAALKSTATQCNTQNCQISIPSSWEHNTAPFANAADIKSVQPWLAL
ncbi:DUF2987 domain-containing protein [Pseudoalteromonas sp. McH1-7]|uniref:DUF2987 domain-containing protein n=1 Tax=Pseudoalteromonas TaxID=53246 RepID=UPI001590190F|nr:MULTISPECIES: DUF2987 domain-containing protein [Pseudoalteromonas]MDW7549983.1 DUF2987 domain-containing protein [Pseudoalteromonas peptidolytica]NUZ09522.1 DUF2987 domain-containing protein [Pseudoalteromonas sp. McH1-7]USD29685.1 DUF2987 domain-containing protein [Pseudoalteromonas sp. SCSIO 43201]